jgi:hypothetical protein
MGKLRTGTLRAISELGADPTAPSVIIRIVPVHDGFHINWRSH